MGLKVEHTYDCQVAGGVQTSFETPVSFVVSITCLQPGGRLIEPERAGENTTFAKGGKTS